MSNSKAIFLCETDYQLFNAIRFMSYKSIDADLAVVDNSNKCNLKSAYVNIKKLNLFKNVFYISKYTRYDYKNYWWGQIISLFRFIFYKTTVKHHMLDYSMFINIKYDTVYLASPTLSNYNFLSIIHPLYINLLEDGTGTYDIGSILYSEFVSLKHRLLNYLCPWLILNYDIHEIYVNMPDLMPKTTHKIIQIVDAEYYSNNYDIFYNNIRKVFHFNYATGISNYKIIYLSQPRYIHGGFNKNDFSSVIESIFCPKLSKELIIRSHPGENENIYNINCEYDTAGNTWEMESMNSVTELHVLTSFFSTAQFVPKILFNKEPYLVFLFQIFYNLKLTDNIKRLHSMNDFIDKIKSIYKQPSKIFVPNTIEEAQSVINTLLQSSKKV